jgi:hypothetical protein
MTKAEYDLEQGKLHNSLFKTLNLIFVFVMFLVALGNFMKEEIPNENKIENLSKGLIEKTPLVKK